MTSSVVGMSSAGVAVVTVLVASSRVIAVAAATSATVPRDDGVDNYYQFADGSGRMAAMFAFVQRWLNYYGEDEFGSRGFRQGSSDRFSHGFGKRPMSKEDGTAADQQLKPVGVTVNDERIAMTNDDTGTVGSRFDDVIPRQGDRMTG